ncbi:MAG: AraC-type DNA-binding protein [Herbinix sp.]|jgi:AraC-like DNA-binding protein|nr:AraC-type DNA-binding protein [Herbinix sp.]
MNIIKDWFHTEFIHREEFTTHRPLEDELQFYNAVKDGDIVYVTNNCVNHVFANPEGMGLLSEHPLQNLKFHFVVTTSMITRHCIDGGMESEKAYCLSDFYIQKVDKCQSKEEISDLHQTMCFDFTKNMQLLHKYNSFTKHIVLCIDYIYKNIHTRITLKDLADHLVLSESYLSKLFVKEVGMSISDYIRLKKIEKAENLLKYSDYNIIDIANYLSFSSQSHFTKAFEKQVGLSPKKYRDKYYRKSWLSNKEMP